MRSRARRRRRSCASCERVLVHHPRGARRRLRLQEGAACARRDGVRRERGRHAARVPGFPSLARQSGRALLRASRPRARRDRRRGSRARRGRAAARRVDDARGSSRTRATPKISCCSSSAARTGTSSATGISSIPSATWLEGRPLAASGPSVEDLEHSRYFLTEWMPPLLRKTAERSPPRVVADLGAGDGGTLWPLDRAGLVGETIYAVDISAEHVALCERLSPKVQGHRLRRRARRGIAGRVRRRGHLVTGDRASARRPRAGAGDREAAATGRLVLRRKRDPWAARVLAVQRQAAGAGAVAARSDAHARVRIGGALPFGARAPGARVRRRALVAAEVPAERLRVPRRRARARRAASEAAGAVPEPPAVGRKGAPRGGRADSRLPLGRRTGRKRTS